MPMQGGLGGEPGNEAHGGYAYCGAAALALLGRLHALDCGALATWAAKRQSGYEGGFNGRTNKLADGCYSFWQGALFALLQKYGPGGAPLPTAGLVLSSGTHLWPHAAVSEETLHDSRVGIA